MSSSVLAQNVKRLLDENNLKIAELERKAGVTKNTVYNIIKGISAAPSAEKLSAIAKTFNLDVKDLYTEIAPIYMNREYFNLMEKVLSGIIEEVLAQGLQLTCNEVAKTIDRIFSYSVANNIYEPDKRFIKWILLEEFSKHNKAPF